MQNDADIVPDPRGFWRWFAGHQSELLAIVRGEQTGRVTERIDEALAKFNLSFVYEVTEGVFGGELTFTPEGDPDGAVAVDDFVAQAPSFRNWVIHSRRQRKSLQTAVAFTRAVHGVDLTDARVVVKLHLGQYHLRFIHAPLAELSEERRYGTVASFLDHALGEAVATNYIGGVDFKPEGEGIDMALVINQIVRETGEVPAERSSGEQVAAVQ